MDDCPGSDTLQHGNSSDRNTDGTFAPGNGISNAGKPHKSAWIRNQIQGACGKKSIANLAKLGESDDRADQDVFWKIVGKSLPQQLQAQVGSVDNFSDEFDAALKRAGVSNNGRTSLGSIPE